MADTDTDEYCSGISFSLQIQTQLFFAVLRGRIADRNCFGIIFYFIANTDAEKYYFRIISAMNSDKQYLQCFGAQEGMLPPGVGRGSEGVWAGGVGPAGLAL